MTLASAASRGWRAKPIGLLAITVTAAAPNAALADWRWTGITFTEMGQANAVVYHFDDTGRNSRFYVVTDNGYILNSTDGVKWTSTRVGTDILSDIAVEEPFGGLIVARNYGSSGSTILEGGGSVWQQMQGKDAYNTTFLPGSIKSIATGDGVLGMGTFGSSFAWRQNFTGEYQHPGRYYDSVSGNPGNVADILYQGRGGSRTKAYWWIVSYAPSANGFGVYRSATSPNFAFAGVKFDAIGDHGKAIAMSDDGNTLVAVGGERQLVSTNGGDSWQSKGGLGTPAGGIVDLNTVRYLNGIFVASGVPADVFISADGLNWGRGGRVRDQVSINDIAYGNGKYVAVGYDRLSGGAYLAVSDGVDVGGGGSGGPAISRAKVRTYGYQPAIKDRRTLLARLEVKDLEARSYGVWATVKARHTSRGDLRISLTSPSGQTAVLFTGKRRDFKNNVSLVHVNVSRALAGGDPNGVWTLSVTDRIRRDKGKLKAWQLFIQDTP